MSEPMEAVARLKREHHAVIAAHTYQSPEVQVCADILGDSFALAQKAAATDADTVFLCGVRFMGESAKILNPDRRVLLPAPQADCPMAHMAKENEIARLRREIPDLAVVCYINSTARLKSCSDVCVTSSNAVRIVSALPNRNILFIPDENLGSFVAAQVPDKKFYFSGGYCPVHAQLLPADVEAEKRAHPAARVLTHPECKEGVRALSDFIGSTSEIIDYAKKSEAGEFVLCTEPGVLYELQRQ